MSARLRYPIAAVAKLTGLGLDTIRAWERRYGAVVPERGPRGRLYTDAQVRRLRLLATLVEEGHPIGQVATLPDASLEELLRRAGEMEAHGPAPRPRLAADPVDVILEAIERFDYAAADREMGRLAALHAPRDLVFQVALPLMRAVGERWHAGQLSVAQEHMVSAILHAVLAALLRVHSLPSSQQLLFATPEGELHEFGILAAAMLTVSAGFGIVYLGPNVPARDIASAAERTGVAVVVVGVTSGSPAVLERLKELRHRLPGAIELWAGGLDSAAVHRSARSAARLVPVASFEDFENDLRRLRHLNPTLPAD